jgi:hypothetical protein
MVNPLPCLPAHSRLEIVATPTDENTDTPARIAAPKSWTSGSLGGLNYTWKNSSGCYHYIFPSNRIFEVRGAVQYVEVPAYGANLNGHGSGLSGDRAAARPWTGSQPHFQVFDVITAHRPRLGALTGVSGSSSSSALAD